MTATGAELAAKLTAPGGALDLIAPENIDSIETNLQIAHAPKSAARDFRTDYLMKVFKYDAASEDLRRSRRWRTRSIASGLLADDKSRA